ncbi:hypothetical protein O3M35_003555 [Rhynocoris fuscipes]|uniref:RING-type E3 ubiquitin transferase (cysteine targeting) n=1 Tax=Rhynocoris fuscipes TaxID=488301 RepID=A0AAW1CLS8_9HEMI
MTTTEKEITPSRVTVLDANELNNEIFSIIKNQLTAITNNLPPQVTYFDPELQTLLKTILWVLSVQRTSATFGQQLLKIKYSKQIPNNSLSRLGFILIGSSYLKQRLPLFFSLFQRTSDSNFAYKIIDYCELAVNIANILYFIKFIRQGGASTFLEYLLGLKPISTVPSSSRNIGYSFMARELIWHGLIELLVLVIPMINYHALKRRFKKYINFTATEQRKETVEELNKENLKCAVCKDFLILPHHMGCSHLFCYYCLLSHRLADKKFECPICGFSNPEASIIPLSLKW